jgi:hypothetical protein
VSDEPTDVDIAMHAASSGSAGHWPTVATVLHGEVERLRAIEQRFEDLQAELAKQAPGLTRMESENHRLRRIEREARAVCVDAYDTHGALQHPALRAALELEGP